jgi:hypothetical protein
MVKLPIGQDTFRLFDRPSFFEGFVGLLDFRPNIARYHTDRGETAADRNALGSDWKAVGHDIKTALLAHGGREQ